MHYKEGGLRRVPQPQAVEAPDPERVHFPHHNKPTDTDYGIESQMGVKAQPVVEDRRRGFRVPAARRPADELCLEGALGRKAQVEDPRGGLGAATPGDKLYATPDTAPGFFKGGGVLPGSNWGVERKARAGKTSLLGGTAIRSLVRPSVGQRLCAPLPLTRHSAARARDQAQSGGPADRSHSAQAGHSPGR